MPTLVKYAIRTASGWAGMSAPEQAAYSQTYESWPIFEAAQVRDLTALDETIQIDFFNDWPGVGLTGENVVSSAWGTSSTNRIKLNCDYDQSHQFNSESGFYFISTLFNGITLEILADDVDLVGIEAIQSGGSSSSVAIDTEVAGLDGVTVKYCIASRQGKTNGTGYKIGSNNGQLAMMCLAKDGLYGFSFFRSCDFYNCGSVQSVYGFYDRTATYPKILRNNFSYNSTTEDYRLLGNSDSENNASSDATASGTGSITNITSAEFEDSANGNYHLASGSALIGAGSNQYSLFTEDFEGDSWPSSGAFDIGFDKFVSAPTGSTGTLDATEAQTDNLVVAGEVLVSGVLNTSEQSTDSFSSTGGTQSEIAGNILAVELATDNYLSSGVVVENGTLIAIEGSTDVYSTSGNVLVNGLLLALEQNNDVASLSGASKITGALLANEQNQDLAQINGSVLVTGLADIAETGIDSAIINGAIVVSGEFNTLEQSTDAFIASGAGLSGGILSASENNTDTAFIQGLIYIQGNVAATEAQLDTATINGIVINSGNINAIEPFNDLFVAFGGPISTGSMLLTEPNTDLMLANGGSATLGNLSVQEQSIDDSAIAGEVIVSGFLPMVESSIDSFLSIGKVISTGNLTAQEQETDSVEMGLTAEDFIDFVDTVYIKSQNNQVMVNNHNTEIYQR